MTNLGDLYLDRGLKKITSRCSQR